MDGEDQPLRLLLIELRREREKKKKKEKEREKGGVKSGQVGVTNQAESRRERCVTLLLRLPYVLTRWLLRCQLSYSPGLRHIVKTRKEKERKSKPTTYKLSCYT